MFKRSLLAAGILVTVHSAWTEVPKAISLNAIGTYETYVFDEGASEIVAYDPTTLRLFIINADAKAVDIVSIADPALPVSAGAIDVSLDLPDAGGVNSVAVSNGIVAVAVEHDDKQSNGWVALYDTDGNF